jgi:translation initiation factor IF-3
VDQKIIWKVEYVLAKHLHIPDCNKMDYAKVKFVNDQLAKDEQRKSQGTGKVSGRGR